MRLIFAGTSDFSKAILATLIQYHEVVAVFCQPDRPKGRGKVLTACSVKQYALSKSLPVFTPDTLGKIELKHIKSLNAQVMIVVAYGQLLPKTILTIPQYGCLNAHTSLLPRWRGASPIVRAIQAGDRQTGVGIMQMDEGLDTGDILKQNSCDIAQTDTAQTLHDKLIILAQSTLIDVLDNLSHLTPIKQSQQGITYAHKLAKNEAWINWSDCASQIHRQIRAFNPYPIAQTQVTLKQNNNNKILDGQTLRIITADLIDSNTHDDINIVQTKTQLLIQINNGTLGLNQVQLSGKKIVNIQAFNSAYTLVNISMPLNHKKSNY